MNLSPNFPLDDMVFSQTAERLGIRNVPNMHQIACLQALCMNVLEPLRVGVGRPIRISSGFRSQVLNHAVHGSARSQHMLGEAADILIKGMSITDIVAAIRGMKLPFDQLIHEGTWVHVSHAFNGVQRGNVLRATFKNGKPTYQPLL